jgi:hypothetical protein
LPVAKGRLPHAELLAGRGALPCKSGKLVAYALLAHAERVAEDAPLRVERAVLVVDVVLHIVVVEPGKSITQPFRGRVDIGAAAEPPRGRELASEIAQRVVNHTLAERLVSGGLRIVGRTEGAIFCAETGIARHCSALGTSETVVVGYATVAPEHPAKAVLCRFLASAVAAGAVKRVAELPAAPPRLLCCLARVGIERLAVHIDAALIGPLEPFEQHVGGLPDELAVRSCRAAARGYVAACHYSLFLLPCGSSGMGS